MKTLNSKLSADSEEALQERFNPFAWVVFHLVAVYSSIARWLKFKRICSWHEPKPLYMGGNPFARRVTHGMCPDCARKFKVEIISHAHLQSSARLKSAIERSQNLVHRHL